MSMRQVLDIVEALLMDESVGLKPTTERLAAQLPNAPTGDPEPPRAEFTFYRGDIPGVRPTNGGWNVMIRPSGGTANNRMNDDSGPTIIREGAAAIDIGYETFGASMRDRVNDATLVLGALRQCLDGLVAFSAAHVARFGSAILDVDQTMRYRFGDYDGPASYGFLASISIMEYANE